MYSIQREMLVFMRQRWVTAWFVLASFVGGACAQQPNAVLARGPGGIQVTAADVEAFVQNLSLESRQATLARQEAVSLIVDEVYARRVLAQKLEASGELDRDKLLLAVLQGQRERTMAESYAFSAGEAAAKDEAKLEALAKETYRLNIKRYQEPATTRASHILFAAKEGDDAALDKARQEADAALKRIQAGEAFDVLARELSSDPGSASNGGDLGYFAVGKMVPEFDAALQRLEKPGDLSALVQTKFGIHIIQLTGRRPAGQRTYDEVREQLLTEARLSIIGGTRKATFQQALEGMVKDGDAAAATAKWFAANPAK